MIDKYIKVIKNTLKKPHTEVKAKLLVLNTKISSKSCKATISVTLFERSQVCCSAMFLFHSVVCLVSFVFLAELTCFMMMIKNNTFEKQNALWIFILLPTSSKTFLLHLQK